MIKLQECMMTLRAFLINDCGGTNAQHVKQRKRNDYGNPHEIYATMRFVFILFAHTRLEA